MYYLQSRYYNSAIGRFISADAYVSTGTGIIGFNMFAYCNNNPIMYVDPSGCGVISDLLNGFVDAYSKSYELEAKNYEEFAKISQIIMDNTEIVAGVGQGIYAETNVLGAGASIGAYANYFEIVLSKGDISFRQRMHASAELNLITITMGTQIESLIVDGVHEETAPTPFFTVFNVDEEGSISVFSQARYYGWMGYSIDVKTNIAGINHDIIALYE